MPDLAGLLRAPRGDLLDALRLLPDFDRLTGHMDACERAVAERRARLFAPKTSGVQHVLDQLADGRGIPDDLEARALRGLDEQRGLEAALALLTDVINGLAGSREAVVRDHADDLFAGVDQRVRQLVEQARHLRLRGASNATEAVERDVAGPWKTLLDLQGRYFLARDTHEQLMSSLADPGAMRAYVDTFAFVANAGDLFPQWLVWQRAGRGSRVDGWELAGQALPWPTDPAERFLWAVAHPEAEVWAPSPKQLADAVAAARPAALEVADSLTPPLDRSSSVSEHNFDRQAGRYASGSLT